MDVLNAPHASARSLSPALPFNKYQRRKLGMHAVLLLRGSSFSKANLASRHPLPSARGVTSFTSQVATGRRRTCRKTMHHDFSKSASRRRHESLRPSNHTSSPAHLVAVNTFFTSRLSTAPVGPLLLAGAYGLSYTDRLFPAFGVPRSTVLLAWKHQPPSRILY